MVWLIPVIGPIIGFIVMMFLAIPFYFLWNDMAPTYFYWLPSVYLYIPFWDCVWLMCLIVILKLILLPRFGTSVETKGK